MIKPVRVIIFVFIIFVLYSCTEKISVDENKESRDPSGGRTIRIVFYFPGDDIGSPEYQTILHKIIESIKSNEAGEILSSGFGMGNMEIVVKVKGEEYINKIKRIIIDNYPDAEYSITTGRT